jgi:hypothetical protein
MVLILIILLIIIIIFFINSFKGNNSVQGGKKARRKKNRRKKKKARRKKKKKKGKSSSGSSSIMPPINTATDDAVMKAAKLKATVDRLEKEALVLKNERIKVVVNLQKKLEEERLKKEKQFDSCEYGILIYDKIEEIQHIFHRE